MHKVYSAPPAPALRQYVRAYAQREVACPSSGIVQPVTASLEHVLVFEFQGLTVIQYVNGEEQSANSVAVVGPHTFRRADIRFVNRVETFAVFFHPLALLRLFRLPLREFVNRSFEAQDVLGQEVVQLWEVLAAQSSFEARVRVADQYLKNRSGSPSKTCPFMCSADHLFRFQGVIPVRELAHNAGVSLRQFERRFSDLLGLTPKLFARIARFQSALDAKVLTPTRPWLEIAHALGYHDQMHMVRDFRLLGGNSPVRTFEALGDARPSALAAADLPSSSSRSLPGIEFF